MPAGTERQAPLQGFVNGVRAQPVSSAVLLLGMLQAVLFVVFFASSIYPIPRWDFYDWVSGYITTDAYFSWLWLLHNEHRVVVSKILVSLDIALFRGLLYPVAIAAFAGLLAWSATLCSLALRHSGASASQQRFILGCLLLLCFPTYTLDSYTYPSNSPLTFTVLFLVAAIGAMFQLSRAQTAAKHGSALVWLGLCLGAAILCSLSAVNGLLVWFVLGWMSWRLRCYSWGTVVPLLVFGGVLIAAHVADSQQVAEGSFVPQTLDAWQRLGRYCVAYFGMPWVTVPFLGAAGFWIGLTVITLAGAVVVWKGFVVRELASIEVLGVALLLFSGATGVATSVARFSLTDLPAHRYTIFVILAHVGLLFVVLPVLLRHWAAFAGSRASLVVVCLLGPVFLIQQTVVGQFATARAEHFAQLREKVLAGNRAPAVMAKIYPVPQAFGKHLAIMRDRKIYLFRETE